MSGRQWHKVTVYVLAHPSHARAIAHRLEHDARQATSELDALIDSFTMSPLHPEAAAIVSHRAGGDA